MSVTRFTRAVRLAMVFTTFAGQYSEAASLCFTGSSHQNVTGHWIVTTTITNNNGRLQGENVKDEPSWIYDMQFKRLMLNNRPALETKITVTAPSMSVSSDYTQYEGIGYYKFHNTLVTWHKAKTICEEEGAHLAIINSKQEEDAIKSFLTPKVKGTEKIFIGVHDLFEEGKYETVLGQPLSSIGYVNWAKNQPNNYSPRQDCATYNYDEGLNDWQCHEKKPFLCELSQ